MSGLEERALRTLAVATAANGGFQRAMFARLNGEPDRVYVPADEPRRLTGILGRLGEQHEVRWAPAPVKRRGDWVCSCSSVLWAVAESRGQAEALERACGRLVPFPTVVLREGDSVRHVAFWALWQPLGYEYVVRANRRLAHVIGGAKKHADPDVFTFVPPGSCLRDGRRRPVPVVALAVNESISSARQVVGGLREAPDPDAWRRSS